MGRGRQGHDWHSSVGNSLTFSFVWYFDSSVNQLSPLSLVVALAMVRALSSFGVEGLKLKWPNDIMFGSSKLGGVLVEVAPSSQADRTLIVIGIGLNVTFSSRLDGHVDRPITDLSSISNRNFDRNKLLSMLLLELIKVLSEFDSYGFGRFKSEWNHLHTYNKKRISLSLPDDSIQEGIVDTIDDDGSLVLILPSGIRSSFIAGELT